MKQFNTEAFTKDLLDMLSKLTQTPADKLSLDDDLREDVGLDSLQRMVLIARELDPGVLLEASGRVSLENVRAVAETGVDLISSSALTLGAPPVDLGLSLTAGG